MSLSLSVLLSVIENGGCEVFSTCKLERRTPDRTFGAACLKCTAGGRRFAKNHAHVFHGPCASQILSRWREVVPASRRI